ncbi:transcriptional regulator, TrmB family [Pseudobacteroides cellulosolvens ATCC 35603 = DSM 2933]|uniref:Transcriptional regulator, TrmB family n=2 Tax=Pseudobacteroides cellulosolvens TaxID=35825 RepID=A0A0L6JP20_9FIRM|nr:transcriptional regulator, TrmB family [Pseudobacteroides cellulosolvens ATCC 35603 = DSM 2933]
MMNLIECLMKTGLTRHESELYVALSREGELTGYEAAKVTGIPRANAYQALAALVEKGGAFLVEGSVPRYTSVTVDEYCKNVLRHMEEVVEIIKKECPQRRKPYEPYITITGFKHILDKIKNIIDEAQERVYISMSDTEFTYITDEIQNALKRGVRVVAIASGKLDIKGAIIHYTAKAPGQIRIIADSANVLTGSISESEQDTCLYSKNKPLVELIKDSLKNEIKLSELEGGKKNE